MSVAALEITDVSKHYGSFPAVKNLSLRIEAGEIFGLLGPNGAGKSSTIHLVSGLCRMEAGSIRVFGHDVDTEAMLTRRLVGLMHQEVVIDNFLTIGQMLKLHSGYYGLSDDSAWRELLVERLALGPHLHKKMMALSGGMKRRFMVAKALIHKPKLLILDEPTAGVDVELRVALWEFVREINKRGTTVLLTTHYLEEAEQLCDRIGIMNHGELIALDSTRELVKRVDSRILNITYNDGSSVQHSLAPSESIDNVLESLRVPGKSFADVGVQKADLEDVFVQLTRSGGELVQ